MSELIQNRAEYTVRRSFVSEMNNAVYLLTAKRSGEQILIDAADDLASLQSLLAHGTADVDSGVGDGPSTSSRSNVTARGGLRWILTTHAHWDHTRALAELQASTGAQLAIGSEDAEQLRAERGVTPDRLLSHGDRVEVDGISLGVIALRGHTPGSMAFAVEDADPVLLFTGDSLFPGGLGNTRGNPEKFSQLFTDVSERVFDRFSDDALVYPGHGNATYLGAERPQLPAWKARGW